MCGQYIFIFLFWNNLACFFLFSPKYPSCLFFQYNTQLGPPYYILVDTNFINFSIKAKLDLVQSMMDCLYAKCKYLQLWTLFALNVFKPWELPWIFQCLISHSELTVDRRVGYSVVFAFFEFVMLQYLYISTGIPCITDCVMAEIEKLGQKYRVALR